MASQNCNVWHQEVNLRNELSPVFSCPVHRLGGCFKKATFQIPGSKPGGNFPLCLLTLSQAIKTLVRKTHNNSQAQGVNK